MNQMIPRSISVPCTMFGVAVLAVCFAGCGPKSSTVSGRVTYQGQPMAGGSVILYCDDRQIVRGIIDREGFYVIPNVPIGKAMVTVRSHNPIPAGLQVPQDIPVSRDGPIYSVGRSPIQRPIQGFPERYALPEESGLTVVVNHERVTYDIPLSP